MAGEEIASHAEDACANSYGSWMVNVMVSLSPGPVSMTEA